MATLSELKQHLMSGGKIRRASWKNPSEYLKKCYSNLEEFINQDDVFTSINFQDAVADDWEIYNTINYADCIGCIGFFSSTSDFKDARLDILEKYFGEGYVGKFKSKSSNLWSHFRPAKPEEIKFYQGEE